MLPLLQLLNSATAPWQPAKRHRSEQVWPSMLGLCYGCWNLICHGSSNILAFDFSLNFINCKTHIQFIGCTEKKKSRSDLQVMICGPLFYIDYHCFSVWHEPGLSSATSMENMRMSNCERCWKKPEPPRGPGGRKQILIRNYCNRGKTPQYGSGLKPNVKRTSGI